jgi:hypothetical protein
MSTSGEQFDYHGALVVIETRAGEIVFIHPPKAPAEAPASQKSSYVPAEALAALRSTDVLPGSPSNSVRGGI